MGYGEGYLENTAEILKPTPEVHQAYQSRRVNPVEGDVEDHSAFHRVYNAESWVGM